MISAPLRAALGLLLTSSLLVSCGSSGTSRVRGVPRNLPKIELYGSAQTPAHSMARSDYPFDSSGAYLTSWASDGRSSSESDYSSWQSSHEGSISRKQPSPVKKVTSSTPKKKTASSSSSSKSKSKGSSSGGGSYTIKKGDTLGAIAAKNGTTVSKLKAANGMSNDFIREGKTLKIPK